MTLTHEKDPHAGNTGSFENHTIDTLHCASSRPGSKAFSSMVARAALAGVTLSTIDDDHGEMVYIVSRWAMTRELYDLDAVAAYLDRVTGDKS